MPRPNTMPATLTPHQRQTLISVLVGIVLVCVPVAVYLPGINGPWLFDDYSNLINNTYLRIDALDGGQLYQAAYSLQAGPLQRPIAMLSFALNYYIAGDFSNTLSFKLVNVGIHAINGLLVFWFLTIVFHRLVESRVGGNKGKNRLQQWQVRFAACLVSLLWVAHPIQLTSVLYVVQRMTQLSALFTLFALIFYLLGRLRTIRGDIRGWLWITGGTLGWGALGILSKENAVLIPVYVAILEFLLFSGEYPWRRWCLLPAKTRYALLAMVGIVSLLAIAVVVNYSLPNYAVRDFTLPERLMTEARVLMFYVSLIVIPQINRFGHQHDDIAISHSLIDPWTTLPAILAIVALLGIAFWLRHRYVLLSLGILWFFAGHLLESTVLPLEIAHEHRNYLPSLGALLTLSQGLWTLHRYHAGKRALLAASALLLVVFSTITLIRASQWSDEGSFTFYEAHHHPNSPRAQLSLSLIYAVNGDYNRATASARRAWELQPSETGYLLNMHLIAARYRQLPDPALQADTLTQLKAQPLTATVHSVLQAVALCVFDWCPTLRRPLEEWSRAVIESRSDVSDKSFFHYLLGTSLLSQGRHAEATDTLRRAHSEDRRYLLPLLALLKMQIGTRQITEAERTLETLRGANDATSHRRDREIDELAAELANAKQDRTPDVR